MENKLHILLISFAGPETGRAPQAQEGGARGDAVQTARLPDAGDQALQAAPHHQEALCSQEGERPAGAQVLLPAPRIQGGREEGEGEKQEAYQPCWGGPVKDAVRDVIS